MSVCTHCRTTNFNKPAAQHARIECYKEYLAKVAHTEEDYIGGNDDLQGDECIRPERFIG